ncbi:MAG TPA: VCBS repeat-containing protein [Polyangia bacterium]|nr:VCBS repeat-containing protein [Polyangia bacterium]
MKNTWLVATTLSLIGILACNTRTPIGAVDPGAGGNGGSLGGAGGDGGSPVAVGGMGGQVVLGSGGNAGGPPGFGGDAGGNPGFGGDGSGTQVVDCSKPFVSNGLFLAEQTLPYPNGELATTLALGDVDGDHLADVVIGGVDYVPPFGEGGNSGAGGAAGLGSVVVSLSQKGSAPGAGTRHSVASPLELTLGDLDGNGALDVVDFDIQNNLSTFLNDGHGVLSPPTPYAPGAYVHGLVAADLDGDKKSELLFADGSSVTSTGTWVFRSATGGAYTSSLLDPAFHAHAVAVGDVGGTAAPDVVIAGDNEVHVLLGNGAGTFALAVAYTGAFDAIALVDFDGDGRTDIAGVRLGTVSVLINLGGGTFAVPRRLPVSEGNVFVDPNRVRDAFGDVNGDGKVDLVVPSGDCARIAVYLNDGHGSLSAPTYVPIARPAGWVSLADVNGDGALDALYTESAYAAGHVRLLLHRDAATAYLRPAALKRFR